MKNINNPDTNWFSLVFNDLFSCNILNITLDSNTYAFESNVIISNPKKESNDNVVIVKTGGHFQVLILPGSNETERESLYNEMLKIVDNINKKK